MTNCCTPESAPPAKTCLIPRPNMPDLQTLRPYQKFRGNRFLVALSLSDVLHVLCSSHRKACHRFFQASAALMQIFCLRTWRTNTCSPSSAKPRRPLLCAPACSTFCGVLYALMPKPGALLGHGSCLPRSCCPCLMFISCDPANEWAGRQQRRQFATSATRCRGTSLLMMFLQLRASHAQHGRRCRPCWPWLSWAWAA